MSPILPAEILFSLNSQFPCRELQIRQLAHLLSPSLPSPPNLVIYGLPSTGKTSITRQTLNAFSVTHAYVNCAECVTARHFYEKIVSTVLEILCEEGELVMWRKKLGRCENIAALSVQLQTILESHERKFVIVLDRIDGQREAPPTLLPAIGRLGQLIPSLTTVLILSAPSPRPLLLHSTGVPHLHFPPYTHKDALTIALASPPPATPQSTSSEAMTTDTDKFYPAFLATLLASLVLPTTSLILATLRTAARKLWPLFIAPILSGEPPPGLSSPSDWDFPRLLLRNRSLFQSESVLLDRLVETPTTATTSNPTQIPPINTLDTPQPKPISKPTPLLPYLPTLTLLSALLASSVPPKQDITIFSSLSTKKKSIRRRRSSQKSQPSSATSTPTKSRISKSTSTPITILRPFPLERLIAILRTIVSPSDLSSTISKRGSAGAVSDLVNAEMPTLERLRLVVLVSSSGGDVLGEVKYKVNVSKEFVKGRVREWGMEGDWRGWEDVGIF